MENLKQKLLNLGLVIDNEYLNKYIELIELNKNNKKEKFKTQKHHVIPKYYYKNNNLEIDNSKENISNLFYKDHILAHYYLALCSKDQKFRSGMLCAIFKLLKEYTIPKDTVDFVNSLDKYKELYEQHCKYRSEVMHNRVVSDDTRRKLSLARKGKKLGPRTDVWKKLMSSKMKGRKLSEETKIKISNTLKGRIPGNKGKKGLQGKNRTTWLPGHEPWNKGKHFSEETKRKMRLAALNRTRSRVSSTRGKIYIHKDNINKLINKQELDQYETQGWIIGKYRSPETIQLQKEKVKQREKNKYENKK